MQVTLGEKEGNIAMSESHRCSALSTDHERLLLRYDTRGPNCAIDCPKDYYGRVCSNNGTCDINGVCICNYGVEGSYCQFGILNDTYVLQERPAS